ncbi:MAG: uracil-DNA glycosylase [Candidatus Woesearchaeota archaeon]
MSKKQALDDIKSDILLHLKCPLKDAAQNLVFGKGNISASIMFIGEAPGAKEDAQGIPFVGSAGKRLNQLLESIGLTLDDVYIANILKYRPPKNRNPNTQEIMNHTPYLVRQIMVIKPKVIIPLGNFATKFVLSGFSCNSMNAIGGISEIHGTIHKVAYEGVTFTVMPSYHPAAMLYRPKLREIIEKDFLEAKKII